MISKAYLKKIPRYFFNAVGIIKCQTTGNLYVLRGTEIHTISTLHDSFLLIIVSEPLKRELLTKNV